MEYIWGRGEMERTGKSRGRETVIRVYCMGEESIFNNTRRESSKKKKKETQKQPTNQPSALK